MKLRKPERPKSRFRHRLGAVSTLVAKCHRSLRAGARGSLGKGVGIFGFWLETCRFVCDDHEVMGLSGDLASIDYV